MWPVFVLMRFRVEESALGTFVPLMDDVATTLRGRSGCRDVERGRNVDDPTLWALTSRWHDIGSYRRALSGVELRVALMGLSRFAVDEPSAYVPPSEFGENVPRWQ